MDQPEHTQQQADKALDAETLEYIQQVFQLVRSGDPVRLSDLLARGLPPNLRNHKGDSLLMLASYHGHLDAARALLEHGADPELRNDHGQTPIAGAAYKGDLPMVRLLLEHGADVEGAAPDGKTALMMAAMFNRTEIVDLLAAHGADINAKAANGLRARAAISCAFWRPSRDAMLGARRAAVRALPAAGNDAVRPLRPAKMPTYYCAGPYPAYRGTGPGRPGYAKAAGSHERLDSKPLFLFSKELSI